MNGSLTVSYTLQRVDICESNPNSCELYHRPFVLSKSSSQSCTVLSGCSDWHTCARASEALGLANLRLESSWHRQPAHQRVPSPKDWNSSPHHLDYARRCWCCSHIRSLVWEDALTKSLRENAHIENRNVWQLPYVGQSQHCCCMTTYSGMRRYAEICG